jgi:predicted RNase H-like nuclease/ppGpp synthetase/RelA/SpoT-type nucleotidyltranferase
MRQAIRVHFIGIDLAWGDKQPTGLAVVDDEARLLQVVAVRTDDEIVAALEAYVEDDCLAAIDAPIVVTNATGSRPAEQQLSKDFRRFDAAAHPSNTGKPEFANGTRAARVARRLGLDIDPRSGRRRRAIEVYPHPATIVLFGLPKVLRYKAKPGRDVDLLRSELLRLMTFVGGVVSTDEAWARLQDQVENATRKSELRRVEDQVDAVLCAYLAHFAEHRRDLVTRYGDLETGSIVTPTLGAEVVPTQTYAVRRAVREYGARHSELSRAGQEAVALVQGLLDDAGINYLSVTGRTKSVVSFAEKAARTKAGTPLYTDPLIQITDLLGVRVITYVRDDVDAVADVLAEHIIVHDDRDLGLQTANEGRFGYASRHLMIGLDASRENHPDFAHLRGHAAQVQVRTVLQHAWAEFEHDIRYKGTVPAEHVGEFDRRFTLAAGLLELADREFSEIRERLRGAAPEVNEATGDDDPRLATRELAAYLAGQYSGAGWSRTDHYDWIAGVLLELGVTSLVELGEVLRRADEVAIAARMSYRHPPGAVRRLDDALLWVFGERYVALHQNAHRAGLLAHRLERLKGDSTLAAPR